MVDFYEVFLYHVVEAQKYCGHKTHYRGNTMRRIRLVSFLLCAFFFIFVATTAAASDLKSDAIKALQRAVVKALPTEGNIIRIAVLDFQGDDGTIRNAITAAITEKTTYKVIERADLDKILTEQGLQLKDILDEKTRIEHGKLKGVQGLLMGKVQGMDSGFMSYSIKINLKLDDVEKGEVVFARDFSETAVSPMRTWLIVAVVLVLVLIVAFIVIAGRKRTAKVKTIKQDTTERFDLAREAGRAAALLSSAKAKLMDKGNTDVATGVKDVEREMRLLRDRAEGAAQGNPTTRGAKELKEALDFDKGLADIFQGLTAKAQKFYEAVLDGNDNLQKQVDLLKAEVVSAANALKARKI
jgi:hypothetical protein